MPLKEIDSLLQLLSERKKKVEQEEAETNMEVLLDFLHLSRQRKQEEMLEVRSQFLLLSQMCCLALLCDCAQSYGPCD